MAQTQRVLLEFPEDDAGFVETLSNKLGWRVTAAGESVAGQGAAKVSVPERLYKKVEIDWSQYSPTIQRLAQQLYTEITAEDIAADPRLAYILSK